MAARQPPLMQDTITLSFCTPLYHSLSQGVLSLVIVMNGWSFTQKGRTVVATSLIQTPSAFVFGIDVECCSPGAALDAVSRQGS